MKTYVYSLDLKPDLETIAAYKAHHRKVWPDVLEGLKQVGILRNEIYLLGNHLVNIMYTIDSFDPERDLAEYNKTHPIMDDWDQLMRTLQVKVPEALEHEWWAQMERVFEFKSSEIKASR